MTFFNIVAYFSYSLIFYTIIGIVNFWKYNLCRMGKLVFVWIVAWNISSLLLHFDPNVCVSSNCNLGINPKLFVYYFISSSMTALQCLVKIYRCWGIKINSYKISIHVDSKQIKPIKNLNMTVIVEIDTYSSDQHMVTLISKAEVTMTNKIA